MSATALAPAPLLGISGPVVHLLCDDTAHAVARVILDHALEAHLEALGH
jgi:hypothetical protein